jgi:phage/plasmid-like protein (TIGR03299 family)
MTTGDDRMAHNIGQMFYYGELPWHTLGNKLERAATLDEAFKAGGLDWTVGKVPIVPANEPGTSISHRVAVVREDRSPGDPGRVIGVVHPGFEPLQNRQGAMIFDVLMGQGQPIYHTGGYLKNGEVIWLLAKLPRDIRVRGDDVLETYLLFTNSHDGSVAIDIRLTTVRVVCQNTLSMALHKNAAGKVFRRAHNGSYDLIKEEAKAFFEFSVKQSIEAEALLTQLSAKPCSDEDFQKFLKKLIPDPTKPATANRNPSVLRGFDTRMETIQATRKAVLLVHQEGIPNRQLPAADPNWWGALNSITAWSDHIQTTESDRYAHVLFGSGDKLKSAALSRIQEITGVGHAGIR